MPLVRRENSPYWYAQFQFGGETIVRSTKTVERKAAEHFEARLRAEVYARGVFDRKVETTVGEALERVIHDKQGTANHRNLIHHANALKVSLGSYERLSSLRSSDIQTHKARRLAQGRSPQTVKHELGLLFQAIRLARRDGFEVAEVEVPRIRVPNSRLRYLSHEEERRLLDVLDPSAVPTASVRLKRSRQDGYDLVVTLIDTGARYSEVAGLTWDQVDVGAGTIRLWRSKVENESVLFMSKRVMELIANRLTHRVGKFVFSNSVGGARGYRVAGLRAAFDRAGLHDCSVHTLRHTHATRLIQNGMTLYEVRTILGHSDIRTTMRYAHLEQADVTSRARALMDRLNASSD